MKLITNPYSLDDCKLEFDKNGYGHAQAKIMKVGKLRYVDQKGDAFFADISLDELKKVQNTAVPMDITIRHPSELLSPKDVQSNSHGTTLGRPEIKEIDGDMWLVDGVILKTDKAINVAQSGQLGTSAGYWRDAIKVDNGNVKFEDIVPNHLAIGCFSPRAKGAELFSLDSSDSEHGRIFELDTNKTPNKKEERMKRKLNGVGGQGYSLDEAQIEYNDESEPVIQKLVDREESLIKQVNAELDSQKASFDEQTTDLTAKNGELSGENKALKNQIEELESKAKESISMDEALEYGKEFAYVEAECSNRGIDTKFETIEAGKRLCVENDNKGESFDDSEINGAFKMLKKIDPKDAKKIRTSKEALKNAGNNSMDSIDKVSMSQISIAALKRNAEIQRRRA